MKKRLLLEKLEEAERELVLAEQELSTAVREVSGRVRADKTVTTRVIETAFDKLRAARSKLSDLKKMVDADEDG
jgi:hypothetical protein